MKQISYSAWVMIFTAVISLLALIASFIGLFTGYPYSQETENWRLQAQGQDVGNILGAAVLLVSAWLVGKGSQRAYVVWVGSLFYFIYAYVVYAMAVHFNALFLVYVALLGVSLYTLIVSLVTHSKMIGALSSYPKRLVAGTLIGIGVLFGLLWLGEIIPATLANDMPRSLKDAGLWVNPIHVIDLAAVLPGFIMAGYLLLKNTEWGKFLAAPWLTFSALMGSSIVAAMVMMAANGFPNTTPPMVMVSMVVLFSVWSLAAFLKAMPKHR